MKKRPSIDDAASKYMAAATKRFAKSLGRDHNDRDDVFVAGFTWGAYQGYIAGRKAGMRKRTAARR